VQLLRTIGDNIYNGCALWLDLGRDCVPPSQLRCRRRRISLLFLGPSRRSARSLRSIRNCWRAPRATTCVVRSRTHITSLSIRCTRFRRAASLLLHDRSRHSALRPNCAPVHANDSLGGTTDCSWANPGMDYARSRDCRRIQAVTGWRLAGVCRVHNAGYAGCGRPAQPEPCWRSRVWYLRSPGHGLAGRVERPGHVPGNTAGRDGGSGSLNGTLDL